MTTLPPLVSVPRLRLCPTLSALDGELLIELAEAVSAFVRGYTGHQISRGTITETLEGSGESYLILNELPIASVTSITLTKDDGSTTVYAGTTYFRFDPKVGLIKWISGSDGPGYFPTGFQNITVVYVAGHDPIPADIVDACVELANQAYLVNQLNPGLAVAERLGDYSISTKIDTLQMASAGLLTPTVQRVLSLYMDRRM